MYMSFRARVGLLLAWAAMTTLAPPAAIAGAEDNQAVLATVGSHPITESDVESRIMPQLAAMQSQIYQLKRQTIQSIADDYVLQQAAQAVHMTVPEYLRRQGGESAVTDDDARKYYDRHKSQYPQPYEQMRAQILETVLSQRDDARRQVVLAKLRAGSPLKIRIAPPRVELKVEGHPQRGPANAPVTIVEFADFQCPFCNRVLPTLKDLREKYGDKMKLVFFDYPLSFHSHSMDAARAARCAREQGKFWEYHDALFADQSKLAPADLKATAATLGLNGAKFAACFDRAGHIEAIQRDLTYAEQLDVHGTPAFFINGRPLSGAQPPGEFEAIVDDELSRTQTAR